MQQLLTKPFRSYLLVSTGLLAAFVAILFFMGRVPICDCGYVKLWHGVVFSSDNSQHISDWYTFSHVIHGFGFYWLFYLLRKRWGWFSVGAGLVLALLLETGWEVLENTDLVIHRYREVTISLDYYGDSIINSLFDVLAMVLGFFLAARFPVWLTLFLVVLMEAIVGYSIRDNLTLNIIMLIYPLEAIQTWQLKG